MGLGQVLVHIRCIWAQRLSSAAQASWLLQGMELLLLLRRMELGRSSRGGHQARRRGEAEALGRLPGSSREDRNLGGSWPRMLLQRKPLHARWRCLHGCVLPAVLGRCMAGMGQWCCPLLCCWLLLLLFH